MRGDDARMTHSLRSAFPVRPPLRNERTHRVTPRLPTDPTPEHEPHPHPDLSWFLRRELVTIPLIIVIVGTLLVFGISPATLLFVVLLTLVVLGFVWGGASGSSE
jgi:hypothetical protein